MGICNAMIAMGICNAMINSKRWRCSVLVCKCSKKSIFVFSNLISTENEKNDKVVGKLFLMIKKWIGVHGFAYALSHKRYGGNMIIQLT
jgi:hypothetical protein